MSNHEPVNGAEKWCLHPYYVVVVGGGVGDDGTGARLYLPTPEPMQSAPLPL